MKIAYEYSFDLPDRTLHESKYIGSSPHRHLRLKSGRVRHSRKFAAKRKIGHVIGRRKLRENREITRKALMGHIRAFSGGRIDAARFQYKVRATMRESWTQAFAAGLRAAGVKGKSVGRGKTAIALKEKDDRWLRGAMAHETRYLNRMCRQVVEGTWQMPLKNRVNMYCSALDAFYDAGRVIGLPEQTIFYWICHNDDRSCNGCVYLAEHSPYTRRNLPGLPRSGICRCLTNCRCHTLAVKSTLHETQSIQESHRFTRAEHIANLDRLKRQKRRSHA